MITIAQILKWQGTSTALWRLTFLSVLSLALSACGAQDNPATLDSNAPQVAAAADQAGSSVVPEASFSESRLRSNIEQLASDEFGGRQPASAGEAKTIKLLRDQFLALDLEPGNGESWFQRVPLVSITADEAMSLTVEGDGFAEAFQYGEQFIAWTKRVVDSSKLAASELVFVGYGIVAPEYGWNDYAGLDVQGKTVVILVNDPGYATQDPELFNGNAMTYYGRWTYKYEEAARQGAAGAIIVHEDGPAGYPWKVVSGSWSGPQFDLFAEDRNMSRVAVEGWVTTAVANTLLSAAGQNLAELKTAAKTRGFQAVPLGLQASIDINNTLERFDSQNVVARIPGAVRPHETVVYTAHWDHIGTRLGEGDQIYNGAVDNATGTAGLIELAAAYKALPEPPERSLVFLAVTAEESGLLGSKHYAENPIYPMADTVAAINMDGMNVLGRTKDVTVVGFGASTLDELLAEVARDQGRELKPEPTPEKGYYYRSDHFNFAKQGVPALYAESGVDYRDRPEGWGLEQQKDYTANRYHAPSDEYDPAWDMSGMLEDLALYFGVGYQLANSAAWPKWSESSEFRAIRERVKKVAALPEPLKTALQRPGRAAADRLRDTSSLPEEILGLLALESGETVLDLFAGGGYYTALLADIVGAEGEVISYNNPAYFNFAKDAIEARFGLDKPAQVNLLTAEINELEIAPQSLDGMLAVMSYHDLHWVNEEQGWPAIDLPGFYARLHAALKPDGRVVIVDHSAAAGTGTAAVDTLHRIDEAFVIRDFANNGFKLVGSSDVLRNPDDDRSKLVFSPEIRRRTDRFILVFAKAGAASASP